jgi:hypothetical protein
MLIFLIISHLIIHYSAVLGKEPIEFSGHHIFNLLRELSFDDPVPDPLIQNIFNLPTNVIPNIMQHISFKKSLSLSMGFKEKDQPLNPLDRNTLNPLLYHDAKLDNQFAIKSWLKQKKKKKKISHLKWLLQNPTVDISRFRSRILLQAASFGDLNIIKRLLDPYRYVSPLILRRACSSDNLQLVKYLINITKKRPDEWDLRFALLGGNKDIINYLVNEYGLDRFGWELSGQYYLYLLRTRSRNVRSNARHGIMWTYNNYLVNNY